MLILAALAHAADTIGPRACTSESSHFIDDSGALKYPDFPQTRALLIKHVEETLRSTNSGKLGMKVHGNCCPSGWYVHDIDEG